MFSFKTLTNKVDDLTNKVDDLTTKFVERSHSFDNKITENTSIILENMRYVYYCIYEIKIVYTLLKSILYYLID